MCIKYWNEKIKKMNMWDMGMTKLSVGAITLFVVSFLSEYIDFIVSWRWIWFAIGLILTVIVLTRISCCGKEEKIISVKVKTMKKKGAIEMSIGTIVIIVIAITMLIFGIVFVRSIMCSAISLTGDVNDNVKGEINKLFGATAGEIQCIGGGGEPVTMVPGKFNIVYCGISAQEQGKEYEIKVTKLMGSSTDADTLEEWVAFGENTWGPNIVGPGDEIPKKILRLQVPDDAPEELIAITIEASRDGEVISTQDLDFVVRRTGIIRSAMC